MQLVGSECSLMAFATGICHYAFIYFKTFSIFCPFLRCLFFNVFFNLLSINQTEWSIPAYLSVFFFTFFFFFFFCFLFKQGQYSKD